MTMAEEMATGPRLRVDPIACDGRGLCAEVFPEMIWLDDWGFPIIADGLVPPRLRSAAAEAVRLCPKLALRVEPAGKRTSDQAGSRPGTIRLPTRPK
jgi:ferredoxin